MVPSLPSVLRWNKEILFCTLYVLKIKRTKIEIQLFNWWIAAGNRLCWESPGGPAGPDDLHLPKDDQVHLPQVRQQRRGQQHEDHDDHEDVPYQRKSKWCLPKVVCILTGRPMPMPPNYMTIGPGCKAICPFLTRWKSTMRCASYLWTSWTRRSTSSSGSGSSSLDASPPLLSPID